jgi:hypothetical protein
MTTSIHQRRSKLSVAFLRLFRDWGFVAECIEGDGDLSKPYAVRLSWPSDKAIEMSDVTREAFRLAKAGFTFTIEREAGKVDGHIGFVPVALVVRHPGDLPNVFGIPYEFVEHPLSRNDNADVLASIKRLYDVAEGMHVSVDVVDWNGNVGPILLMIRGGKLCIKKGSRSPIALDTRLPSAYRPITLRIARKS